jgi:hypothetical protein
MCTGWPSGRQQCRTHPQQQQQHNSIHSGSSDATRTAGPAAASSSSRGGSSGSGRGGSSGSRGSRGSHHGGAGAAEGLRALWLQGLALVLLQLGVLLQQLLASFLHLQHGTETRLGVIPAVFRWRCGGVVVALWWCSVGVPVALWWRCGGVPVALWWCCGGVPVETDWSPVGQCRQHGLGTCKRSRAAWTRNKRSNSFAVGERYRSVVVGLSRCCGPKTGMSRGRSGSDGN